MGVELNPLDFRIRRPPYKAAGEFRGFVGELSYLKLTILV